MPFVVRKAGSKLLLALAGNNVKYQKIAGLVAEQDLLTGSDLLSTHFLAGDLQHLLQNKGAGEVPLNDANSIHGLGFMNTLLAADYKTYLPDDILVKVDRATMSAGLEGREPFLDHRIIEWAARLPAGLKYNNGDKKYLIKKLTHKYLPAAMMNRPKMGFRIPVEKWLKGDLKILLMETVNDKTLSQQNVLNKNYVVDLLSKYFLDKAVDSGQVWLIFMFMLWWKEWME